MRVLGIDPGLATMGYAILEAGDRTRKSSGSFRVLEAGVIRTPAETPLGERLHTLYSDVCRLISEYKPDVLAIEELFFSQNRTTAMAVAQARGVLLLAAHELSTKSYTPLQVKLRIAGYGRAKKPQMQKMMQQLLHLKEIPKPDDAADALAVALCYLLEARVSISRKSPIKSSA